MKNLFAFLILFLIISLQNVIAKTTLAAGDIAITGVNMDDPDEISIVFLVDIESGTEIKFTDNGWKSDNTWRGSEGIHTWTASSAYSAGDEIVITLSGPALAKAGDQVIAYQNTSDMIGAINDEGDHVWQADATSTNTSALPQGLTNGTNCVALTETDNIKYDRSVTEGTKEEILSAINDYTNWSGNDGTRQTLSSTGFTISAGSGVDNPAGFSASESSTSQIDLSWTKNGNDNNVMVAWNSSNTFGVPSGSYSVGNSISGGGTVIYNSSGTSYNHTSLDANKAYYYKAWSVDGFTNYSSGVTANATTYKLEPTNHVSSFSAVKDGTYGYSRIDLSWTENDGSQAPDGYLVKASTADNISDPSDGTAVDDNTTIGSNSGAINLAHGTTSYEWTGLSSEQTYYFKIYPYTNSGTAIDYKIDGTVPSDNAMTDAAPLLPNAWLNEIHYDDSEGDLTEFIEIAIENSSSYDLSDFTVELYNGNGGAKYSTTTIDGYTVGSTINNITLHTKDFRNTIQNGSPDGIALSYQEYLIQFLSYEGIFTATDGYALGSSSTDIDVAEDNSNAATNSLQLLGSGTKYSDFSWSGPHAATKGRVNSDGNNDQSLPVSLQDFNAIPGNGKVTLSWITESETENLGFNLYRGVNKNGKFLMLNAELIAGHGSTSERHDYSYVDKNVVNGVTYYYKIEDVDYAGKTKLHNKTVSATPTSKESDANINQFRLYPCYPNPFNPNTNIRIFLHEPAPVKLQVYNLNGKLISTLLNTFLSAGGYNFVWNATDFRGTDVASGVYFIRMAIENQSTSLQKVLLVR